jgi:hypothetical protein
MYRIHIKNLVTGNTYAGTFPTELECWEWHESKERVHGSSTIIPPTAEVTITNIDQEVLDQVTERNKLQQSMQDLKNMDWSSISDPVVRKVLKDVFTIIKSISNN